MKPTGDELYLALTSAPPPEIISTLSVEALQDAGWEAVVEQNDEGNFVDIFDASGNEIEQIPLSQAEYDRYNNTDTMNIGIVGNHPELAQFYI